MGEWETARWGLDYRVVQIMCASEGSYASEA